MLVRFGLFILCLFFALPAQAENYTIITFPNLVNTMVRFNALDLKDDALLEEYTMITDCDLYSYFYPDDFKWNQVKAAVRESVRQNIATFPTEYQYDTKVQLGRYDFKLKNFRFSENATIRNVNTFLFSENSSYMCANRGIIIIPALYRGILDVPVSVLGLPFAEDDAKALLRRMDEAGNRDHILYARFLLRVVNIDPLRKIKGINSDRTRYAQNAKSGNHEMLFDVRLDSVNFYEDEDMTKLIYSYRP